MKNKKIVFYLLLFLILYIGLIAYTRIDDYYLERKLATFDLNNDGIFSLEEQTLEQQKYFNMVIGDGGRNVFMPIIGLFVSFTVTGFLLISIETYRYIKNRRKRI